jgi:hypothetical protein
VEKLRSHGLRNIIPINRPEKDERIFSFPQQHQSPKIRASNNFSVEKLSPRGLGKRMIHFSSCIDQQLTIKCKPFGKAADHSEKQIGGVCNEIPDKYFSQKNVVTIPSMLNKEDSLKCESSQGTRVFFESLSPKRLTERRHRAGFSAFSPFRENSTLHGALASPTTYKKIALLKKSFLPNKTAKNQISQEGSEGLSPRDSKEENPEQCDSSTG